MMKADAMGFAGGEEAKNKNEGGYKRHHFARVSALLQIVGHAPGLTYR